MDKKLILVFHLLLTFCLVTLTISTDREEQEQEQEADTIDDMSEDLSPGSYDLNHHQTTDLTRSRSRCGKGKKLMRTCRPQCVKKPARDDCNIGGGCSGDARCNISGSTKPLVCSKENKWMACIDGECPGDKKDVCCGEDFTCIYDKTDFGVKKYKCDNPDER